FVWDDVALVLRDPLIRSLYLIPEGFQHFLFTDATASSFYRPIQRLTYTLEYAAFGFAPAAYHVTSVLCHLAAAVALLCFARELLSRFGVEERVRRIAPVIAALIWAIHPIQTSAVAYVSGRADSLAAAFGFAGLYLALVALRASGARVWLCTSGAALACLLSALSKEAGLIFLALWPAMLLVQNHRKATLRSLGIALAVLEIYLSLRLPAQQIAPPSVKPLPALVKPVLAARAFAEYAGLIALPLNLRMERDVETRPSGFANDSLSHSAWRELQTLAGVILIAGFLWWMLRERKRDRAVFAFLLLTVVSYLPVSGAVPLNATVAEHWLYLPSAFLFVAATLVALRFVGSVQLRLPLLRGVTIAIAAAWVLFLGGRTFVRTLDWKDQRTFLDRTIAAGGNSARMLINLAGVEMSEGRFREAKDHLELALKKEPEQPLAIINLAAVALKTNDFAAAHELLARAQKMPLVEAQAHEMLTVLENKETGQANLLRMRLAARTGTPNWAIEKRYVKVLDESGATDAAIRELQHFLAMQWYRADSWQLLSDLIAKTGRTAEAAQALALARRYDSRLTERAGKL
ncbi:MAG TPA: tetratricopeptide repeat protein, partial [Chthoniobacterales bacterium]